MDTRNVPTFPIIKLWRDDRDLPIRRLRDVLRDDVDGLFAAGPVQIVVAQRGAPLLWIQPKGAPLFWKRTLKSAYYHTVSALNQQPDYTVARSYLFFPSVWEPLAAMPVVLLEGIFWPAAVQGAAPS
jgi:hypothetical protein